MGIEQKSPVSTSIPESSQVTKDEPLRYPYNRFADDPTALDIIREAGIRFKALESQANGLSLLQKAQQRASVLEGLDADHPGAEGFLVEKSDKLGGESPIRVIMKEIEKDKKKSQKILWHQEISRRNTQNLNTPSQKPGQRRR